MEKLASEVRIRRIVAISLIVWLALLFISFTYGEDVNLLKELGVEDLVDKTRVVIITEQPAQFRFFRLLEPERIEVKVLDADHRLGQEVIPVNKGSIDRIKLERAQTDAKKIVRVLIYPQRFSSYHLLREGNKIIVEIIKPAEEEAVPAELAELELKKSRETQAKKYYYRGKSDYKKGDYSGAVASFKKALEINPDYPEAQGYLAKAEANLLSLEKKEELARLKEAKSKPVEKARLRSKEESKRLAEHFKLGEAYYKKKMFQEAMEEFESALAEDPGSKKARNLVFKCKKKLIELEQEWIKAEQRKKQKQAKRLAKEKAQEEREKKRKIIRYWNAGKKYWRKGDFLKASEEWSELLSIDPTFERIDRYILPEELEKSAKSRQMSEEELELFHQLAQIRGLYWQAQDKAKQEQAKLRKQINRHYQLGVEYYKNGYWQEAVSEFQMLLKLDSKHAKAQKLFLESRIKSLEDEKKKRFVEIGAEEKIREDTRKETKKEEERPEAKETQDELRQHYKLGKRYYRQDDFKKAASEFEQVLKIDPTNSPASRMLALSEKEISFKDTERQIQLAKREYERAKKDIFKESPWGKTKLALGLSGSVTLKSRYISSAGARDKKESTLDRNIDLNFRKTLAKKNRFLLNLGTQESDNDNRDTRLKRVRVNYSRDRLLALDTAYHESENNWLNPYNKSLTYTNSHIDLRTNIPNIPKLHVKFQERKRGDSLQPPDTKTSTQTYQMDATHKIGPTQFWVNRLVRKFDDELDKVDDTEEETSSAKVKIVLAKFLSFFQEYKRREIEKENNSDWGYQTDTWSSNLDLKPLKNLTIKAKLIDKSETNKETKQDTNWITRGVQVISRFFGQKLFLNFGCHQQEKDIDVRTKTDKDSRKTTYSCDVRLRPWKDILSLSCNYQNEKEKYTDPSKVKMDTDRLRSGLSFKPVKFLTLSTWYTISERKYKYRDSEVLTTSFYYQGQFRGLRGKLTLNSGFRTEGVKSANPSSEILNDNKSVNANLRYNLTPRLNLNMNGRYTWFEGSTNYDKTAISSSIGWRIFDDTRIKLAYSFVDLDSHTSERDYTTDMFDLSLVTRF